MPKIRNIIIFVGIAAVLILGYVFLIPKSSPDQGSLTSTSTDSTLPNVSGTTTDTSAPNPGSDVASDFLALLLNVSNIKLNDAIFSDPAFNSLHDSSIILVPDGTEGRPNPFAQFGNDAVVVPPPTAATTPPTNTTAPDTNPPAGAPTGSTSNPASTTDTTTKAPAKS